MWFRQVVAMGIIGDEITLSSIHTCAIDVIEKRSGVAIGFPRFAGNCWLGKSMKKCPVRKGDS